RLLNFYYSTGGPLPCDKRAHYRIAGAQDEDERGAVDAVIDRFFVLSEGGYRQRRADRELAKRSHLHKRLSDSGRLGASKKWGLNRNDSQAIRAANSLSMPSGMASPQPEPPPQKEKDLPSEADASDTRCQKSRSKLNQDPEGFDEFWNLYPNSARGPRQRALKKWRR